MFHTINNCRSLLTVAHVGRNCPDTHMYCGSCCPAPSPERMAALGFMPWYQYPHEIVSTVAGRYVGDLILGSLHAAGFGTSKMAFLT